MSNTTIYLIRHGEVDNPKGVVYGRSVNVPLSEAGFTQMEMLAAKLKRRGVRPEVIYASPLTRALQSAEIIREVYGNIPIIQENDLLDTNSPGLESQTIEWLKSIGWDVYNYQGPEVVGLKIKPPELQAKRIIRVLKRIQEEHRGQTIFVISHRDPVTFAIWRLLHPRGDPPSITELVRGESLGKGEAWKVVLDGERRVLESELITKKEGLVKGERE